MQQVAFSRKNDNNEKRKELNEQFKNRRSRAQTKMLHIFSNLTARRKTKLLNSFGKETTPKKGGAHSKKKTSQQKSGADVFNKES